MEHLLELARFGVGGAALPAFPKDAHPREGERPQDGVVVLAWAFRRSSSRLARAENLVAHAAADHDEGGAELRQQHAQRDERERDQALHGERERNKLAPENVRR